MSEPTWLPDRIVPIIHDRQLRLHGGLAGIRDPNLLASALAYPKNLFTYYGVNDIAQLATAYASRIAQNHAFLDGNKRTAWVCCYTFAGLNGFDIELPEEEVVTWVNLLASSECDDRAFCAWLAGGMKA